MHIQRLFIHPVKSLYPVEVASAIVTDAGFEHDRSFVLVKDQSDAQTDIAEHLTIKSNSQLCLFRQSIDTTSGTLTITFTDRGEVVDILILPLQPDVQGHWRSHNVEIFGSIARGFDIGDEARTFFSEYLKQPVRLLYIGRDGRRAVPAPSLVPQIKREAGPEASAEDKSWLGGILTRRQADSKIEEETVPHPQQIRFNDGAPLLLTTTASEEDARSRLAAKFSGEDILLRFRTNIHVDVSDETGFKPYDEDDWKKISVDARVDNYDTGKSVELDVVFRTPRCQSLNVDFDTGGLVAGERQLYKLLARDRRVNPAFPMKPCFGVYAFAAPMGMTVRTGDIVKVVR